MKRHLLAIAAASIMGSAIANAADMPVKYVPPAQVFNWTGFYLGVHVGGTWGTTESEITSISVPDLFAIGGLVLPVSSHSFNGFVGGGQAGYNWQSGIVVFGVEGELSATNAKGTARICRADGRSLYYGGAWSHNEYSASLNLIVIGLNTQVSDNRSGFLVGAGIEHAFAGGLSAKLEYEYIDYGKRDYHFPLAIGVPVDIGTNIREYQHVMKVGVNYRFGAY